MNTSDVLKSVKFDLENETTDPDYVESEEEDENIIIQNFSAGGIKKIEISSMLSTLLAQREVDQKKFILLNKKNSELEVENSKLDMKLHYIRLDLSNALIKLEEAEMTKKSLENATKQLVDTKKSLTLSTDKSDFHRRLNLCQFIFWMFFLAFILIVDIHLIKFN